MKRTGGMDMMAKKRRLRMIVLLCALLVAAGAIFVAWEALGVSQWQQLDEDKLLNLAQTGAIYDKNGAYMTTLEK